MSTKQDVIASADAELNSAGLPTYTELLEALRSVADADTGRKSVQSIDRARELVERVA